MWRSKPAARPLLQWQAPDSSLGSIGRVLLLCSAAAVAWISSLVALLGAVEARSATDQCTIAVIAAEPDVLHWLLLGFPLLATVLVVLAIFVRAAGLALAVCSSIVLALGLLAVAGWWTGSCPSTTIGPLAALTDPGFIADIPVAAWLVTGGVLAALPQTFRAPRSGAAT